MRFSIALPIVLSVVGFVLAMLAVFAGNKPGFMEDYYIVMLNTSQLGHNLVPTPSTDSTPTSTGSGIGGFVSGLVASATAAVGAAESKLASIEGDIADQLAQELGIKQFYSLHVMDTCEGFFTPNATAPGAGYNVTNCTAPMQSGQYNVTALLDVELNVGPVHLSLADLKWSQDLQDTLDKVAKLLLAMAILYIIGASLSGLSFVLSAIGLFTYARSPRPTAAVNAAFAWLATIVLLVANLITTIGGKDGTDAINDKGQDIGISADKGDKFLAITWVAFAAMAVAAIYWTYEIIAVRRSRKRGLPHGRRHAEKLSMDDYAPPPRQGRSHRR